MSLGAGSPGPTTHERRHKMLTTETHERIADLSNRELLSVESALFDVVEEFGDPTDVELLGAVHVEGLARMLDNLPF